MKRIFTRRFVWIPIMIALLALGAFVVLGNKQSGPAATTVVSINAKKGEFVRESKATGSVEARTYTLNFPAPGRVANVLVLEGQPVEKGALLTQLDTSDEQARLNAAKQNLDATNLRLRTNGQEATANLNKINSQLLAAKQKLALTRSLYATGTASKFEMDELARSVTDLESQIQATNAQTTGSRGDLDAQRAAKQSEIEQLNRAIRNAQLRAPVAGTISKIGYLPGTETGANNIQLIENATLQVRLKLQESEASFVKIGQPAFVELDAVSGKILNAKVKRVEAQAEVSGQGGSAILPVVLRFTDAEAARFAQPGLTVAGRIITLRIHDATIVPLETMLEENKQNFVWEIVEDNKNLKIKKRIVTVRSRNLTSAAVTGIAPGAKLVSLPSEELKDGAPVKLFEDKKEKK